MTPAQRKQAALGIALTLAIPAEGLRQFAYRDPPGILTVCYGSTTNVVAGKKYSLEECKQRLDADMRRAVDMVERCVPGLPVNALAAFADTVYNVGPRIACNTAESTAARMLASGRIEEACRQLPRWNKARVAGVLIELPGLTKRRAAAMRVCLGEDAT